MQVLLRMLPNYYHHVRTYDNTLITKFFGLHRVKPSSGQKVMPMLPRRSSHLIRHGHLRRPPALTLESLCLQFRFVVMGNMFCTALRIHRRYDLKGSSLGRSTDKVEIDENTTLKDLDLNYCFYLEPSWRDVLLKYAASLISYQSIDGFFFFILCDPFSWKKLKRKIFDPLEESLNRNFLCEYFG